MRYHIGIDIGSISVNTVIIDEKGRIVKDFYDYCQGRPYFVLLNRLNDILKNGNDISGLTAITGTGGKLASELLQATYVNEIIAQSTAVARLFPHVRTIIEMGGEDSKLILLDENKVNGYSSISDFSMNSLCAAGTGSFLDQQANRIGISIIDEFGSLALKSEKPPRIAGRCSVFAKSDMIHLQQIATPLYDIVAGLCFAVARNFKSTVGRGRNLVRPVIFQGGVAANAGMVRAFREIYGLQGDELIVPEHYASMGAIGALLYTLENGSASHADPLNLDHLIKYLNEGKEDGQHLEPLIFNGKQIDKRIEAREGSGKIDAYLGIDVGSLSTNLAVIDDENRVIARRYLPTAGKPLDAIQKGLKEIRDEVGNRVNIKAVGTTGSGRYLTGDFVGADTIQNEITAQATAAIAIDPEVDTIFEIGGQDSKYIHIDNGVIVDFEMNKVCAAGTGSFLEEQANKLDINIVDEFAECGLRAKKPARLGERCTVFMESDLNTYQQMGYCKENLIAGLSYSIVQNYLNRVVRDKPVGNKIFFQGGVTNNKAVIAAFESVTGKHITVPPHFDITGAIGAAILARRKMSQGGKTGFKGFDIGDASYVADNFVCEHCANHCEIRRVRIENELQPLYYGGICERYEKDTRKSVRTNIPDLFAEREKMLLEGYSGKRDSGKRTIGIPRGLMNYYQMFPFWNKLFSQLGFNVELSDRTDRKITTVSLEVMTAETCLPVEVMHGHVLNLMEKNVDYIFMPFVVNSMGDESNPTNNCNCPWIQSHPYLIKAAFSDENIREKLLIPSLHFRYFDRALRKELTQFIQDKFAIAHQKVNHAITEALMIQRQFENRIRLRGAEILKDLSKYDKCVVLLGRPYNTTDPALNLRLVQKLIHMNILPIPLDYLPLEKENIFDEYPGMYWPNGQKILAGARCISKTEGLFPVYISNFRCGPDSFLLHFVKDEIQNKPLLHLEVDEHSADAGMITRMEAFLDSLKGYRLKKQTAGRPVPKPSVINQNDHRTIYFPYARDTVHVLSAATRLCGIPSEVLPMQTQEDIELGRKYTAGTECFPLICTTGSFLKKLMEPGIDPKKVSFFMPDHNGPCRFGEYNKLHRIIFDNLGFGDAEITHPSNEDAYASIAPGCSMRWRLVAWKGINALDLLRKMQERTRPYEKCKGETDRIYQKYLDRLVRIIETGAHGIGGFIRQAANEFNGIHVEDPGSKPVVAIVGEIFMRDNPFCSNFLVEKLEKLGAETLMAPFAEWVNYSTLRYIRDSKWKERYGALWRARLQLIFQESIEHRIRKNVSEFMNLANEVSVKEMLDNCGEYIHRDYDGDPPLAIGSAKVLSGNSISGVVNILPFTCMPGTINCSVSQNFRKDHNGLPWENFAYDGTENIGQETRFEAFMYQVRQFSEKQKKAR
ncbi:MAG: hypothetical protein JXB19_00940 [Bacteroidales bacterium]|nr:hypothetical protein [Bacteroidales bacterium]